MTTIKEIAKHTGFGKSTISRVVNNDSSVSVATRRKVLAALQKYGYRPNGAARDLRKRENKNLAIVIPQGDIGHYLAHYVNAEKIDGISAKALEEGYRLSIVPVQFNDKRLLDEALKCLSENNVAGAFMLSELDDEDLVFDFLQKYSIKTMLVNWKPQRRNGIPHVMSDYQGACETAFKFLTLRGGVQNSRIFKSTGT